MKSCAHCIKVWQFSPSCKGICKGGTMLTSPAKESNKTSTDSLPAEEDS